MARVMDASITQDLEQSWTTGLLAPEFIFCFHSQKLTDTTASPLMTTST